MKDVPLAQLDDALHDAVISLENVAVDETGTVTLTGTLERPLTPGRWWHLTDAAEHSFTLKVPQANDVDVDDPAGIAQVLVQRVHFDAEARTLTFTSAIPGRLVIRTGADRAELAVDSSPVSVRTFLRWKNPPPPPSSTA